MKVRSHQGDYEVRFVSTLDELAGRLASLPDAFVVADERVVELYPTLLRGVATERMCAIAATEGNKTLEGVETVCRFLQGRDAGKRSNLIVAGGGILQDIGAFCAHVYYRGIPFTYVPTTLLSMADSCIGAKCGVNLGQFKNQLGFFQAPASIEMWTGFARTLSADDVRSGYGEVLKLAITGGEESLAWFEVWAREDGLRGDPLDEPIRRSLRVKQHIIEEDEYENGIRKILNYGHTFGHALEAATMNAVPHGLAVAWGLDVANFVARERGLLDAQTFERIHALVARFFRLPAGVRYDAATIAANMRRDKKAAHGTVGLILLAAPGDLRIVPTPIDASLQRQVAHYVERYAEVTAPA